MPSQYEKSTLCSFGTPQELFNRIDIQPLLESVTDEHRKRIKSSIKESYYVFPKSNGLYSVESADNGVVENTYTVNLNNTPACSCHDYLLRCTGSGMSCKHIWRVRILIRLEALPSQDEDVFAWLVSEIYKDREWISSNCPSDVSNYKKRLRKLEKDLNKDGRQKAHYKKYMNRRCRILMDATTEYSNDNSN